jgi:hypothetical protein
MSYSSDSLTKNENSEALTIQYCECRIINQELSIEYLSQREKFEAQTIQYCENRIKFQEMTIEYYSKCNERLIKSMEIMHDRGGIPIRYHHKLFHISTPPMTISVNADFCKKVNKANCKMLKIINIVTSCLIHVMVIFDTEIFENLGLLSGLYEM